ncbi:TetR/AcrR family transcriptional regulator [Ewingella sp. AOP8-B2-18]
MRYESEHKAKIREQILNEAAKAIRINGPEKVSVAGVMSQAGLTHGGFYAHFASKEALIEAAIGQMFDQSMARWDRDNQDLAPREQLAGYIDFYLSPWHRDNPSQGCPVAVLLTEAPRMTPPCRTAFSQGIGRLRGMVVGQLRDIGVEESEAAAVALSAELMGTLSLARCEPDIAKSDALLAAAKKRIMARLSLINH